jgi:hypothetical protein
MTFVFHFIEADVITCLMWCCVAFRSLALDPLWRQVGLEGDDIE